MAETESVATSPSPANRRRFVGPALAVLAFALVIASFAWSPLSLAALLALVLAAAELRGRAAVAVAVLGGLVVVASVGRFIVRSAMPSLVGMGRHAASERALSELREVLWAQDLAFAERKAKGLPLRYAFLHELVEDEPGGASAVTPPLSAHSLMRLEHAASGPTTFRAGGYLVRVFLPARGGGGVTRGDDALDAELAARTWVAYAWPERVETGTQTLFVAEDESLCISDDPLRYVGLERAPAADAALGGPGLDARRCGRGQDGAMWRPWRGKKPRRR